MSKLEEARKLVEQIRGELNRLDKPILQVCEINNQFWKKHPVEQMEDVDEELGIYIRGNLSAVLRASLDIDNELIVVTCMLYGSGATYKELGEASLAIKSFREGLPKVGERAEFINSALGMVALYLDHLYHRHPQFDIYYLKNLIRNSRDTATSIQILATEGSY